MSGRSLTAELAELVGRQARRALAAVRDPRARALRRRRRARRSVVLRSGITLAAGTITAMIGSTSALEISEVAAGSVTALLAVGAGAAGVRLVRLHRSPLPPPPQEPPAALPPPRSAAREPMARLSRAEAGLHDLFAVLERERRGVAVVDPATIEATRSALAEATGELRGTAEALQAVERAAQAAGAAQRPGLLAASDALRGRLDEGVDEVCGLVSAAGAVVSAAASEHRPDALADATDRLTGLAEGLREVSHRAESPGLSRIAGQDRGVAGRVASRPDAGPAGSAGTSR